MKRLAQTLTRIAAAAGALCLFRSPAGLPGAVLWLPKLWAQAWAPFLALAGLLGSLLGLLVGDGRSLLRGLLGALAALRYTSQVTADHNSFEEPFGRDWRQQLRQDAAATLTRPRYTLIQPTEPPVPWRRDLPAGDEHAPLCDIWEPPESVLRSGLAVIYLHGSLWQAMDKDFFTRPLFRRLAHQGHLVVDLAYSLAPAVQLDQMLSEVRTAVCWLKRQAPALGIDPGRIVLTGASGGGHLALLTAYTAHGQAPESAVRAVVSIYGVADMVAYWHHYGRANPKQPAHSADITSGMRPRLHDRTWLDRFLTRERIFPAYRYGNMPGGPLALVDLLGGTLKEVPERYRQASPLHHVGPHCPPTLQLFGTDDIMIPHSQGRHLHRALGSAGVPSVYVEYPHAVHAFDHYFGVSRRVAPAAQAAAHDIDRFLALMTGS